RERFTDDILQQVMLRYAISSDRIHLLDGFESFIYEFERAGKAYILRIGHSLRRSANLIHGEVDWLNHLADGGAGVARAILSNNARLVEPVDDQYGDQFLACAFVKAQGKPPREAGWTPERYQAYGRLLGRIHALSKTYEPTNNAWKRPEWDDELLQDVVRNLPLSEAGALKRYRELMLYLHSLPKDSQCYGLVHYDPHEGNLLMNADGCLTLFDFDDCAYCWYVYDIAMVVFYISMGKADVHAFLNEFLPLFLRGYRLETGLQASWLTEIHHFLKLREIELYAAIHRSFNLENIDNPWVARFMQGRKERIENNIPVIEYPFESMAGYL
ncbi:MAG: phosphotransferase enzyme family protein, partial [Anaerolineales bacterium]